MQLGTRWAFGAQPPRLPEGVLAAIAAVESEVTGLDTPANVTGQWRWTLTWLEGRPVVELDDGTTIRVDYAGEVVVQQP